MRYLTDLKVQVRKKATWFTKYRRLKKKYKLLLEASREEIHRLRCKNGKNMLGWDIDNVEKKMLLDCIREYRKTRDENKKEK